MIDNNNNQKIEEEQQNITYQDLQRNNNISEINVVNTEKDLADRTIEKVDSIVNTHDHEYEFTQEEKNKYKKVAALIYVPFVVCYYLFTGKYKESAYLKFHSNQGLITTISWLIAIVVNIISNSIFSGRDFVRNTTPFIVEIIIDVLYCIAFILTLFGVINTLSGKSKELLIFGKIKLLK